MAKRSSVGGPFALAFLSRTAIDWLLPTVDFHMRATVSTILGAAILLVSGFRAASRSGSFAAGTVVGVLAAAIAAPIEALGAATLLAVWHDATTMAAIRGSGGLGEVLTLPIAMVLPGFLLGTMGGVLGAVTRRMRSE